MDTDGQSVKRAPEWPPQELQETARSLAQNLHGHVVRVRRPPALANNVSHLRRARRCMSMQGTPHTRRHKPLPASSERQAALAVAIPSRPRDLHSFARMSSRTRSRQCSHRPCEKARASPYACASQKHVQASTPEPAVRSGPVPECCTCVRRASPAVRTEGGAPSQLHARRESSPPLRRPPRRPAEAASGQSLCQCAGGRSMGQRRVLEDGPANHRRTSPPGKSEARRTRGSEQPPSRM